MACANEWAGLQLLKAFLATIKPLVGDSVTFPSGALESRTLP